MGHLESFHTLALDPQVNSFAMRVPFRGRPDKAVPLFLHNKSLRLQALPSVRAFSDCKPVAMEMEVGGERRDEVHGDRLLPVAALGPKSPLRALRAQLAELGRPTYGNKYHCWKRLQRAQEARAEADAVARHDEAMAVGAADVQVPGRPVEPLSEERERHNVSHLPPQPWCEHCVRGRAPEGDHKRATFEQADKELPVIAFDFAFLKTSQGSGRTVAYATQLVAVDVDSGVIRVVPAPKKNVSDYLVTGLRKFVESTFHTKVRLRCDNEPAAIIIAERVQALLPGVVVLENTPRRDHAANPAERAIRSVEDQVRVLGPDVFEASLRHPHARRSCDSKGGRLCCEQSADWENSFFFSGGSVKLGTLLLLIFMSCKITLALLIEALQRA